MVDGAPAFGVGCGSNIGAASPSPLCSIGQGALSAEDIRQGADRARGQAGSTGVQHTHMGGYQPTNETKQEFTL